MIYFVGNISLLDNNCKPASIDDVVNYCKNQTHFAIDTETSGVDYNKDKIIMLQIGDEFNQYVIDTRYVSIIPLKEVLESELHLKLGHNIKFDYKFLLSNFNIRLRNVWDTMLAECVIHCGKVKPGYSLLHTTKRYLNIDLNKNTRDSFSKLNSGEPYTKDQIEYGAKDVEYLIPIMNEQKRIINDLNLNDLILLENEATLAFAEIEYNGLYLNQKAWRKLAVDAVDSSIEKEDELDAMLLNDSKLQQFVLPGIQIDMFGGKLKKTSVKWSSPIQVKKVLLTLDSTLEDTSMRELYKRREQYPIIETIIDYRKECKLASTYGLDFLRYVNKTSQRVHTMFWQILNTGRVSSGMKGKFSYQDYPNMQNIPARDEYRNCFEAESGYKIITMDYSGQELRLIAEGSQDSTWLEAFKNGEDVHGKVASMIFDIDISKVKNRPKFLKGKSYRDVAKTINFGLAYGMSYYKLADTLNISQERAKEFIDKYFSALPKIKAFLNALGNYGKEYGHIKTFKPYRRIRWFEDHKNLGNLDRKLKFHRLGEIERASKNTPIQGSGADMIKYALSLLLRYINDHNLHDKVRLITQIHDEIGCEVKENFTDEWVEIQREIMMLAGKKICKSVDMVVDHSVSDKWSK
jgi:DNA polymerase-1